MSFQRKAGETFCFAMLDIRSQAALKDKARMGRSIQAVHRCILILCFCFFPPLKRFCLFTYALKAIVAPLEELLEAGICELLWLMLRHNLSWVTDDHSAGENPFILVTDALALFLFSFLQLY